MTLVPVLFEGRIEVHPLVGWADAGGPPAGAWWASCVGPPYELERWPIVGRGQLFIFFLFFLDNPLRSFIIVIIPT